MNKSNEENKRLVYDLCQGIYGQSEETIGDHVKKYYAEDVEWHGPHPINTLIGVEALIENFYKPLLRSFPDIQKDTYILFGGQAKGRSLEEWAEWKKDLTNHNEMGLGSYHGDDIDSEWVCTVGNYVATFEKDFLDIPATSRPVWIRFGEYQKVQNNKIVKTIVVVDFLDLMRQAGIKFYPPTAQDIVSPGPFTLDGIQLDQMSEEETQKTLDLVNNMLFKGLHADGGPQNKKIDNTTYWHKDFMYYTPCGIGATRGIKGFEKYHQLPFLKSFPNRQGGMHETRFAEGHYACSTGPVKMTHLGSEWLGIAATGKETTIRAMDIWRRDGDLLRENWLFLDIVEFLYQIDIDLFERIREKKYFI